MRVVIKIKEVSPIERVKDKWDKLVFKGEDDKEYNIFNKRDLFPVIKIGATISADVEEKEYQPGKFDRKVTAIDGAETKKQFAGGFHGKSQEEIHSIESQKRADIIANLWIGGCIDKDDPLINNLRTWLNGGVPSQNATGKPVVTSGGIAKELTVYNFKDKGEGMTYLCNKLDLRVDEILKLGGLKSNGEITDINAFVKKVIGNYQGELK